MGDGDPTHISQAGRNQIQFAYGSKNLSQLQAMVKQHALNLKLRRISIKYLQGGYGKNGLLLDRAPVILENLVIHRASVNKQPLVAHIF